ncbi:MAG: serine hydrolase [Planctomycetaceae bacterium]
MTHIYRLLLFGFILLGLTTSSHAQGPLTAGWVTGESLDGELKSKLDQFAKVAEELKSKTGTPGAAIAVIVDGKLIYRNGLGFANLEKKLPVEPNTLFAIGSCTKAFTGFLAAQLVDEAKIGWLDPAVEHIPNFRLNSPYATNRVRLKELFTHTTGVARHDRLWLGTDLKRDDVVGLLSHLEFSSSLRERYEYNNLMFTVGGLALANAADTTWDELVRERIFKPLQMKTSFTKYDEFMKAPSKSIGYDPGGIKRLPHRNVDTVGPSGSITSSIVDMTNWLAMLVNSGKVGDKQLASVESFNFTTAPQVVINPVERVFYGIGWEVVPERKFRTFKHGGGIDGQNCYVKVLPEANFGIVIMANQQSDFDDLLSVYASDIFVHSSFERDVEKEDEMEARKKRYLADISRSQPTQTSETPIPLKIRENYKCRHALEHYLGNYRHPAYGMIQITRQAKNRIDFTFNDLKGPIAHRGYEYFHVTLGPRGILELGFRDDGQGKVAAVTTRLGWGDPEVVFVKEGHENKDVQRLAKPTLDGKDKPNILRSNKLDIVYRVGTGWPNDWQIIPSVPLDTLDVKCPPGRKVRVTFQSDVHEKKFAVSAGETIEFEILLPDGKIAKTAIVGK